MAALLVDPARPTHGARHVAARGRALVHGDGLHEGPVDVNLALGEVGGIGHRALNELGQRLRGGAPCELQNIERRAHGLSANQAGDEPHLPGGHAQVSCRWAWDSMCLNLLYFAWATWAPAASLGRPSYLGRSGHRRCRVMRELAQLVTHHVFRDEDRNELPAIVDSEGMAHELGENRGARRPGLHHRLLAVLANHAPPIFLRRCLSTNGPFLIERCHVVTFRLTTGSATP